LVFYLQRRFWNGSTNSTEVDVPASNGSGNGRGEGKERRTPSADI